MGRLLYPSVLFHLPVDLYLSGRIRYADDRDVLCFLRAFISGQRLARLLLDESANSDIDYDVIGIRVYLFLVVPRFFIGNIKNKAGFITLYSIHLVTTIITVNYGLLTRNPFFITQLPFVLVSVVGVILLPVTNYNRNKNDQLQGQLEDANKRISELVKLEERQRIARDLHDTLGQKLSLIGLKSDLAGKLMTQDTERAQAEINDVRQTARTALKEVREMVTRMRGPGLRMKFSAFSKF